MTDSLVPALQASLDAVKTAKGHNVIPMASRAARAEEAPSWLMAPSVPFIRDARGSAWVDSATERTMGGRPRRVKTARASGYGHQPLSHYAVDLREERHLLLGICRFSRMELDQLASWELDDPRAMEQIDLAIVEAKQTSGLWFQADRGSVVHAILEHDDRGEDCPAELLEQAQEEFRIAAPVLGRLRANWRAQLDRNGLRILAIEQTCVTDEFNVAGTSDRVVELLRDLFIGGHYLPAGTILILDVKTSALYLANGTPAYWNPYSCQLYLYAASMPYLVGTDGRPDRRVAWPFPRGINVEHGLIGHVNLNPLDGPLGDCHLWHVDLVAGRELALLSQQARRFESRRDLFARSN